MKTVRVSLFGVPAHPVVNDVPGSLLPAASLCDVLFLLRGDPSWSLAGFRFLQLGNASALLAGALGALDFLRLPNDPDIQRLGRRHAAMNVVLLPVFILCQIQRRRQPEQPSRTAVGLLLAANVGLNVAAWHGAQLVYGRRVRTGERRSAAPLTVSLEPSPSARFPEPVS